MDRRRFRGFPRLATTDGTCVSIKSRARPGRLGPDGRRRMNAHQIVSRQSLAARSGGLTDGLPVLGRDQPPLLPLDDFPLGLFDVDRELHERIPEAKNVADVSDGTIHPGVISRDYSSRQHRSTRPVPETETAGTLSPMGRGVTPQLFVKLFCGRVDYLVEQSGRSNAEIAKQMGVEVDTFRRYRKRLLMPHHLIHRFCDAMGVKPEFLLRDPPATIEVEAQVIASDAKALPRPAPARIQRKERRA